MIHLKIRTSRFVSDIMTTYQKCYHFTALINESAMTQFFHLKVEGTTNKFEMILNIII